MGTHSKWKKGNLHFYNGGVGDDSVGESTAASTTIANYGITRLKSSAAVTWKVLPPQLGSHKKLIVSDSTWASTIIFNAATVNNSTDNKIVVTLTTKTKALGVGFDLHGATTALWYMNTSLSDINSTQVTVTMTSS